MQRVAVDIKKQVGPGLYEVVGKVTSGDAQKLTLQDFQKGITAKYGDKAQAVTYEVQGNTARALFRVHDPKPTATLASNPKGEVRAAFIAPLVITLLGLLGAGFLWWRIQVEVTEGFQIVEETLDKPGAQVAAGGFGVGFAALGVAALFYVLMKGRSGNGNTQTSG